MKSTPFLSLISHLSSLLPSGNSRYHFSPLTSHLLLLALSLLSLPVSSQLRLQPLFTDGMVLQQQSSVPIWGSSEPHATITACGTWNNKPAQVTADVDGRFTVYLSTPSAGGPYEVEITERTSSSKNTIVLRDVLIGEVWLCSGQSNMDMPVGGWGQVDNYTDEIARADHPQIRLFHVDYVMSPQPQTTLQARSGGWQRCSPATVANFSATAYFFGRDIALSQNVPVGLIHSAWCGTPAEPWVSAEALSTMHDFAADVARMSDMPVDLDERRAFYDNEIARYNLQLQADADAWTDGRLNYASPSYDDRHWDEAPVGRFTTGEGYDDFDGILWYRTTVDISASQAAQPLTLDLGTVDDNDFTYFNGTLVGHTDGYAERRVYHIPESLVKKGRATILVRCLDGGGNAGLPDTVKLQGKPLTQGWRVRRAQSFHDLPKQPRNPVSDAKNATVLFNGMIHPLVPFTIKGVVWYQGEDNVNRAWQYRTLLPLLINDWRSRWGCDLHFYIAGLANHHPRESQPASSKWAELREAQLYTAAHVPNCHVACLTDIGSADDIHPKNKQETGRRLALLARRYSYGNANANEKVNTACGPVYKDWQQEGHQIRIFFDHAEGLHLAAPAVEGAFAIAGSDGMFYWADARVEENTVVVSSPKVAYPVSVRYNWSDNPLAVLRGGNDLPAYPFRTDDWPGVTYRCTDY